MACPSLLTLETAAFATWPALRQVQDGHWLWRWGLGYTKRANSLNFLDPEDTADLIPRLDRMIALSARNHIPFVARLSPLAPPEIETELLGRGFVAFEQSRVLWRSLEAMDPDGDNDFTIAAPPDEGWIADQCSLAGYDRPKEAGLRAILACYAVPVFGITLHEGAQAVASCLIAISGGIACPLNVVTAQEHRGRGLGLRLMRVALRHAHAEGARSTALAVIAGNKPAEALYARLGYGEIYRYRYLRPDI